MKQDPYRGAFQQSEPAPPPQRPPFAAPEVPPGRAISPDTQSAEITQVGERIDQRPPPPLWQADNRYVPPFPPHPGETPRAPLTPVFHGAPAPAGLLTLDYLDIKRKQVPAKKGWRAALYKVMRINLGPGRDESYELSLCDQVNRIVRTTFLIAVLNLKGGVGKTVVCEALGSTFAKVRGDRVINMDLDPDGGNLIDRHGRQSSLSLLDLASDTSVTRYLDVRAHTSMNASRLEVLASPDYARTDRHVERDDLLNAMTILREHYSLVLMDCGTTLKSPVMDAVLRESRALVIVSSASIDAMKETETTLERLRGSGFQHLLESTILAINHTEPGKPNVVVNKAVEQFSRQLRPDRVIVLPFDHHVHEGREIVLELLSRKSKRRYLQMAAALSEMFPRTADAD
jgi:MinD-like ATPase involved in chromosome partitioning or flagellar assembly